MAVRGAAGGWLWKPGARGGDSGDTPAPEVGAAGRAGRAAAAGAQVAFPAQVSSSRASHWPRRPWRWQGDAARSSSGSRAARHFR